MAFRALHLITVEEITSIGIPSDEAETLHRHLTQILRDHGSSAPETWRNISKRLLNPNLPFSFHQMMFYGCYIGYDSDPPAWIPDKESAVLTNIGCVLERHGKEFLGLRYKDPISSFSDFQKFSVSNPEAYWKMVLDEMSIPFSLPPSCILREHTSYPGGQWLAGASLNSAGNCLSLNDKRSLGDVMVIWRDEGYDDLPVHCMTLKELRAEVGLVANAIETLGLPKGSAVAIDMPMTVTAVTIYLAIVLVGYVVVSIADSFAPLEISTRLKISDAKAVFTQDYIVRGDKNLPLYSRVVDAHAPMTIVVPTRGSNFSRGLRDGDISWHDFLGRIKHSNLFVGMKQMNQKPRKRRKLKKKKKSDIEKEEVKEVEGENGDEDDTNDDDDDNDLKRNVEGGDEEPNEYTAVEQSIEAFSNILFSSGTTGEPKAIPWTHATPLKAAADAWSHMDIRKGDVVAWPTNLGWMMGPWLVYATLLNGASMALYNGSPLGSGFAKFVQDAKVTMLGVVPSIVRAWKNTNCTVGLDWSTIRCFSSTGEASSVDEYLWLMGRAHYKPVIEYCGGTEIGGGFVSGSLLQSQSLAAFSTPAMGCTLLLLGSDGNPLPQTTPGIGELALDPTMFGASTTLLNADHYDVYFRGMPVWNGKILRRHGDEFERTAGGYYRAHGRADDTMNLGGIKVSSLEIERICNGADDSILETAAIGVPPSGGGPEQLVIAVVFKNHSLSEEKLDHLKVAFNSSLQKKLNPLFRVSSVVTIPSLPRTASNKVMRRVLRQQFSQLNQRTKL